MVDYWNELGCARILPMGGFTAFEWQELQAFINVSKYPINHEEAKVLMDMSRAFSNGYSDDNPLSIAPMERV